MSADEHLSPQQFGVQPWSHPRSDAFYEDAGGETPEHEGWQDAWSNAKSSTHKLSAPLASGQDSVYHARVMHYVKNPGTEPIRIAEHGGRDILMDGHHKLVAAHIRGDAEIAAVRVSTSAVPAYNQPTYRDYLERR